MHDGQYFARQTRGLTNCGAHGATHPAKNGIIPDKTLNSTS